MNLNIIKISANNLFIIFRQQLKTNVMGTKAIINLCRELNKLDVFIYVSTTYSNPLEMVTEEKVYDSTAYALDILDSAEYSK
jgi:nucleoside-diphosphate-sugar epimerase